MSISVSVIMSVYNSEKFLKESVASILNQTFSDFEFIIIDDCSTDNSLTIIKAFAEKDSRIKIIRNSENIGLTKSLNKALSLAKGKYIARMDADDIALPERFEKQVAFLETHPSIFLLGTQVEYFNTDDNTRTYPPRATSQAQIEQLLRSNRNPFAHPSIMFRNEPGICYREKFVYAQDFDLYLNLLSQNKQLANLPQVLLRYRLQPGSVSFSRRAQQELFRQKAFDFFVQRQKNGHDNYARFDAASILQPSAQGQLKALEAEIEGSFKLNQMAQARQQILRYFKEKGIFNKYPVYFLASFLPKKMLKFLRETIWRKK